MRRFVPALSIVVVLIGLEIAVGAVSVTLGDIRSTLRVAFADGTFVLPRTDFVVGVLLAAGGLVLGVVGLWSRNTLSGLHHGPACPACGAKTQRIKRRRRHRAMGRMIGVDITRRHCSECDWTGLSVKI